MSRSAQSHRSHPASRGRLAIAGTALLAVLAIIFVGPAAAAQDIKSDGWKLEEIVPEDTLLFLKCSGVEQLMADRPKLDLFKIWAEEEVQQFFEQARGEIPKYLDASQPQMFPFKDAWALFRGDVSIACSTHIVPFAEGAFCATALSVDMAGKRETFLKTVDDLIAMAEGLHFEQGEFEHRNHTIHWIGVPKKRAVVCFTTVKNLFVATFGKHYMKEIIDCHLDGKPSLSEVPSFRRCKKNVGGSATRLMAWVNFEPFTTVLAPFMPYEGLEALDELGLNGIDSLCLASAVEGGGARDSLFISAPGKKKGLLKALAPRPVSAENARLAPADSIYFVDAVYDLELLAKEADRFVGTHLPEFYGEYRKGLDEVRKEIGLDLEKDILGPLGDEISFAVSMPQNGMAAMIPDMILTVKLDDVEGFNHLRERLFALIQNELKVVKTEFNGRTMHRFVLPEPGIPFSPTMVVEGGRLIVTGTPLTMKKYLKRLDSGAPGLSETEVFKNAMASVPKNASAIEFADTARGVGMVYSIGAPFMATLFAQYDLPFDAAMLPMTETITDNISSGVAYAVVNEEGILLAGRWSIGVSTLASVAVSAVDYLVQNDLLQPLLSQTLWGHGQKKKVKSRKWDIDLNTAYGLMQAGQWSGAVEGFTRWIDANPGMSDLLISARTNRGYCFLKLGHYLEGVADYEFVAANCAKSRGLAYYNMACGYSLAGDLEKALACFDRGLLSKFRDYDLIGSDSDLDAIRKDRRFGASVTLMKKGDSLMASGRYAEGEAFYTGWIEANKGHSLSAWAFRNRGYCRLATGQNMASIPDYETAASLDDSMKPVSYYNISCAYSRMQKTDKAIHYLEKALVSGFNDFKLIESDPDMDNIRKDPRFKALLKML